MLRIAVQSKGRLFDETMFLLEEAGIEINIGKRSLLVAARNFPLELLFLRDDDIPFAVSNGVADIGIVGENEYEEKRGTATLVKRLGFSKCRLVVAVPKEANYSGLEWLNGKTVATSYPNILKKFFRESEIEADINVISGSVEIAPRIGIADAIFDIVSSGSTLTTNSLKAVHTVMESEAVLLADYSITEDKQKILEELVFRFEAVIASKGKKYVMLNAPKTATTEIIELLPGLKSPTITPLANSDWVAMQSVIDETRLWEIIGKLKALGAEDILVIPIEKMIL